MPKDSPSTTHSLTFLGGMLIKLYSSFSQSTIPNLEPTASQIGGYTDEEKTFNSTGKYTFQGDLTVKNLYLGGTGNEGHLFKVDKIVGYNDLRLWPDSSETASEVLYLSSDGNVGIGATDPGTKLTISLPDTAGSAGRDAIEITRSNNDPYRVIIINKPEIRFWSTSDNNQANIYGRNGTFFGTVSATGLGSFNEAEQWSNFITSKTGYGDTIGIGGDNIGDDVEIRINAPSTRNKVVFWNPNVNSFANIVANNADFTGNVNVSGNLNVGGNIKGLGGVILQMMSGGLISQEVVHNANK